VVTKGPGDRPFSSFRFDLGVGVPGRAFTLKAEERGLREPSGWPSPSAEGGFNLNRRLTFGRIVSKARERVVNREMPGRLRRIRTSCSTGNGAKASTPPRNPNRRRASGTPRTMRRAYARTENRQRRVSALDRLLGGDEAVARSRSRTSLSRHRRTLRLDGRIARCQTDPNRSCEKPVLVRNHLETRRGGRGGKWLCA
jgi:hypothetical protein